MEPPKATMTEDFNTSKGIGEWMGHGRALREKLKNQANVHEEEIAMATGARDSCLAAMSFIDTQLEIAQKDYNRLMEQEDAKAKEALSHGVTKDTEPEPLGSS